MKKLKKVIWLVVGLIIGISTTVGAATIFRSVDITYSSSLTTKKNVKDSLDELYTKASKIGQCPNGKSCIDNKISKIVELGDYISMTPTSTSYRLPVSITGYGGGGGGGPYINPSELNLWRVIKKNSDNSIEVISEYVSNAPVTLYGSTSYKNFVGALNQIAAQYTNEKYVQSTRYLGYNGQTEYCTGELKLASNTNCGDETQYQADIDLVKNVLGTLVVKTPKGTVSAYWIASRQKSFSGYTSRYYGDTINEEGNLYGESLYEFISNGGGEKSYLVAKSVRPVLTLKADIKIKSGDGASSNTAYQLN